MRIPSGARWLARTHGLAPGGAERRTTPISRSWQFAAVGGMLAIHSDGHPIYAQLTIAGLTLRWRLAVQNRVEGEALVKPAVDARARVREAARNWRECLVGSPEAKTALAALLREQRRFRDALRAVGASRSKGWAEVVKALKEPPPGGPDGVYALVHWAAAEESRASAARAASDDAA